MQPEKTLEFGDMFAKEIHRQDTPNTSIDFKGSHDP